MGMNSSPLSGININFIPGVHLHNCFIGKYVVMKFVSSSTDGAKGEERGTEQSFCAIAAEATVKRRSNKVLIRLFMIVYCLLNYSYVCSVYLNSTNVSTLYYFLSIFAPIFNLNSITMKKVLFSICMAGAAFAMSSCGSTKETASLSSLNGEWNIIEVNGSAVVPAENQELPFIGFDTATGKVYGNSGCNRMMGSIDLNSKPGTIDMSRLGSTRMACPDMTTEQNVLNALGQVKSYKKLGKQNMALCNASSRPVVVLQKKVSTVKLSALNGEWKIEEVNGEAIPSGMEKQPFISFDIKKKSIHGNAGCNLINGGFETDKENPRSISFPNVISTMMACPDMEVESKVMKAINEVKSFDVLSGGGIGLYNADGTLVMVLVKK